jgi:hypothetical protein
MEGSPENPGFPYPHLKGDRTCKKVELEIAVFSLHFLSKSALAEASR